MTRYVAVLADGRVVADSEFRTGALLDAMTIEPWVDGEISFDSYDDRLREVRGDRLVRKDSK